jgi:hypothetical protein
MKKFVLPIFLVMPVLSMAQIRYVGPKAGVTVSNYKSRTPWKEVTNTGYAAGVNAFKQR